MEKSHMLTYGLSLLLIIVNIPELSVFGIYSGLGGATCFFALGLAFGSIILLLRKSKPSIFKRINLALAIGIMISLLIKLTPKR